MSLIVGQMPRLPEELVNNAAFVKYVDHDPVRQAPEASGGPAEKVQAPRFDRISISPEALAAAKDLTPKTGEADSAEPAPSSQSRAVKHDPAEIMKLLQTKRRAPAKAFRPSASGGWTFWKNLPKK